MTLSGGLIAFLAGLVTYTAAFIAEIVRDLLPDADITFENETGGYEDSSVFLMDNSRLVNEFGLQYRPYPERVLQIINEVRSDEGLPKIST